MVLPNLRHAILLEAPEQVAPSLMKFVSQHEGG